MIELGCWTEQTRLGNGSTTVSKDSSWDYRLIEESGSHFAVSLHGQEVGEVQWSLIGVHNVANALAAISAAEHIGVKPSVACEALQSFEGIKRRMELRDTINNIAVYDDFAHHPTAISTTLSGLRKQVGDAYCGDFRATLQHYEIRHHVSTSTRVFKISGCGILL